MPHWSTALEHVPLRVDKIRPAAIRDATCADHLLKAQNQRHKQRGGTHCGLLGDRHRSNLSGDRLRRADSGIFAAGTLEHGHLPAVDGDVLLQARGATVYSERSHPNSYTGNQLPSSSASLPRRPTAEVQNICGQRHGRFVLSLVRNISLPRKHHGTHLQLQLSRFLGGVEQSDRGDKAGRHYPTTGAIHGTAQRTVHRRRPGYPKTKGDKGPRPMEIGPQRASIRAASTAPQIVPPSASGLPSLCPEMRKRVAQGDFRLHSHQQ